MKHLKSILILTALLGTSSVLAAETVATVIDGDCRVDKSDGADKGYRFTKNSNLYADQCVDGDRFRPIENFSIKENTARFDNYLHDGKFWTAKVSLDPKAFKAAYFQVMRFEVVEGVIAAHTQIRFVYKDELGVQLQKGEVKSSSNDILVSFEAGFPKDVSYNFALGAFSNYARLAKIMSTEQKHNDSKTAIEQYEMDLSSEEIALLLKNSLTYSAQIGMVQFYNTLRPNCTTEAFDMIDSLPRFQGKFAPFLTMISPDPVAGPSIDGLAARKLIKQRVQDFADELNGVQSILEIPKKSNSLAVFLPDVDGRPWSMVVVLPDDANLSAGEKQALEGLRQELILSIPSLVQSYGAIMMLTPEEKQGKQLFLATLKEFVQKTPTYLRKINSQLPKEAMNVGLYFAPLATDAAQKGTSLVDYGIPAQIPFAIQDYRIDRDNKSSQEIYYHIGQGVLAAGQVGPQQSAKAFLMGAAVLVHLQRDRSRVTTQLIAGLESFESPMDVVNPQVRIDKIILPKGKGVKPAVLISHAQQVSDEKVNEVVDVQFGPFGQLAGTSGEYGFGSYQIYKAGGCRDQIASTPYFQGSLNDQFTGFGLIDFFIKGSGIQFHVLRLGMNLKSQEVTSMDLAISTLGFKCIDSEDAEKQFTENANKSITELLNQAKTHPLLQKLGPLF